MFTKAALKAEEDQRSSEDVEKEGEADTEGGEED